MIWETIKRRVADDICSRIAEGRVNQEEILVDLVSSDFAAIRSMTAEERGRGFGQVRRVYADKVRERIEAWDIRAVGRLRELFPAEFPKSLRSGPLVVEYDAAGNCSVVKA